MKSTVYGKFPEPDIAVTNLPVGNSDLPIGGTEDPLQMTHSHRADFVPRDLEGRYRHFNYPDSDDWNTLWMCFLPAKFEMVNGQMTKVRNAFFHTEVNGSKVFEGHIKTGTRSARRIGEADYTIQNDPQNVEQDPERDLYVGGNNDKRIRILGHWGSTVMFKDMKITSVGSV